MNDDCLYGMGPSYTGMVVDIDERFAGFCTSKGQKTNKSRK